jgi:transcriptional regulator with XRE-family HTH domain
VSTESEIREFLTLRRAKVTPETAGLPRYGRKRRVAGLRREEVALLAEISVEYYARLERGNARGVSTDVLEGIADALRLDDVERRHLLDLVRAANEGRPARRAPAQHIRPSVKRVVDAITRIPAFVGNGRLDILHVNAVAEALYSEHLRDPIKPANSARFAGDMALSFEVFELPADPGLTLATYTAEPGSESEARLRELAEWGATRERLTTASAQNTV